jgi:hypothetical protein
MARRRSIKEWLLILAALFAVFWAVFRASVQSMTQDEGDTYFWFASRPVNFIWYPFPNNHILNTALMWIAVRVFPLSSLTVRLPALLGAILYVAVCYFLCRSITDRFWLQFPVFICLVYNPFVFDFMVAARGYSLGNAFLLAAIAIPVWYHLKRRPSLPMCCGLASLALGLSFAATFSLVFVDLAAFVALAGWALALDRRPRILGFCVLPGLLVTLVFCGYPLSHWPKGELLYGANSLGEMTRSLVDASLDRPNPRYLLPELYDTMEFIKPALLPLLGGLCVLQLLATKLRTFAAALAGIIGLSVMMSWLAFRLYKVPMPMTRTGVFLLPLCTLLAGVIAAAPARSFVSRKVSAALNGVFIALACYFLLCLRWHYFREYEYDADAKDVYSVLARLNHKYGVADVEMDGEYVSPLNFYRVLSNKETFPDFRYVPAHQLPAGRSIYVVGEPFERDFIQQQGLVVIYRGKTTEAVVAVRPGMIER